MRAYFYYLIVFYCRVYLFNNFLFHFLSRKNFFYWYCLNEYYLFRFNSLELTFRQKINWFYYYCGQLLCEKSFIIYLFYWSDFFFSLFIYWFVYFCGKVGIIGMNLNYLDFFESKFAFNKSKILILFSRYFEIMIYIWWIFLLIGVIQWTLTPGLSLICYIFILIIIWAWF